MPGPVPEVWFSVLRPARRAAPVVALLSEKLREVLADQGLRGPRLQAARGGAAHRR